MLNQKLSLTLCNILAVAALTVSALPSRTREGNGCVHISSISALEKSLRAENYDCIEVAAGRYYVNSLLKVTRSVTIVAAEGASPILDGSRMNPMSNIMTVFNGTNVAVTGIRFTEGHNQPNSYPFDCSGGVLNLGNLTMTNCMIDHNTNSFYGGGIANYNGHLTLIGCTVSSNGNPSLGGGLYTLGGSLLIKDSMFLNNSAAIGGGITSLSPTDVYNTTISLNTANSPNEGQGGGVANFCAMGGGGEVMTLTNCTVSNNTAAGYAGGISVYAGSVTLYQTIVQYNKAPKDAGVRVHQYDRFGYHNSLLQVLNQSFIIDN